VLFSTFGPDGFQRRSNGPGANLGTHSPRSYGAVPDPNKIPKWIASSKLRKSCGGHSGTHNLGPAIDFFQIFLTIVAFPSSWNNQLAAALRYIGDERVHSRTAALTRRRLNSQFYTRRVCRSRRRLQLKLCTPPFCNIAQTPAHSVGVLFPGRRG
jgi:hypothetical protein